MPQLGPEASESLKRDQADGCSLGEPLTKQAQARIPAPELATHTGTSRNDSSSISLSRKSPRNPGRSKRRSLQVRLGCNGRSASPPCSRELFCCARSLSAGSAPFVAHDALCVLALDRFTSFFLFGLIISLPLFFGRRRAGAVLSKWTGALLRVVFLRPLLL